MATAHCAPTCDGNSSFVWFFSETQLWARRTTCDDLNKFPSTFVFVLRDSWKFIERSTDEKRALHSRIREHVAECLLPIYRHWKREREQTTLSSYTQCETVRSLWYAENETTKTKNRCPIEKHIFLNHQNIFIGHFSSISFFADSVENVKRTAWLEMSSSIWNFFCFRLWFCCTCDSIFTDSDVLSGGTRARWTISMRIVSFQLG